MFYYSFIDPFALKHIYTSVVRSHLEFAIIIWDYNIIDVFNYTRVVLNNFFHFISFKFNIFRTSNFDK